MTALSSSLVALAVNLQLARQLADSDPAALKTLLEEIGRDVQQALEDVRQLAWRIYPSLLLDRGLVEALRAAASDAVVPTRVEATGVGPIPVRGRSGGVLLLPRGAAERSRARWAGERATIRVRHEHGALRFEVIVDGADLEEWAQMRT